MAGFLFIAPDLVVGVRGFVEEIRSENHPVAEALSQRLLAVGMKIEMDTNERRQH
jgi:hypothetical protein